MKVFKGRKIFNYLLILIVINVWGVIIFNIINYFKSDNDTDITINAQKPIIKASYGKYHEVNLDTIAYIHLGKSPFVFRQTIVKPVILTKPKLLTSVPQMRFNISGVIINNVSRLVILQDLSNNQTVFLSEGDKYKDITIKKIDVERVLISVNRKDKEIVLKRQ